MIKRAQGSMNERKQRGRKRSKPSEKGNSFPYCSQYPTYTAKFSNEKQRALCYFWDDGDARFGREGPLPLPNPFSGMCDLSLPADWKPPRPRWPGRERRASLSGGAALKEFRDSSAPWRPITPLSQVPSSRAIMLAKHLRSISLGGCHGMSL